MTNHDTMRILLVDDEKDFIELMLYALRDAPHEIIGVTSGEEALPIIRDEVIDLLVTDVRMPGMSGMSLMEKALELQPRMMVIALSAHGRLEMAVDFMKKGAVDFLQKPIDTMDLQLAIQSAAETWQLRRELSLANRHLQEMNQSLEHEVRERKRAEEQLRAANQELQAALHELSQTQQQLIKQERLGALGQMARGIAHDFNNALQPIMLAAGFIQSDPKRLLEMGILNEYIEEIVQSTEAAAATVKRLVRFYSTSSDTEQQVVDLAELIESVVDLTRPRWKNEALAQGKDVDVVLKLTSHCLVQGFREDLREVFVNLIFNAVEAIQRKGRITLSSQSKGGNVVVSVQDDGRGMSEEMRAHCIEPFVTTRTQKGSGLGLSVVHGIVTNHSGNLEIESTPDVGTTVRLTFPLARRGSDAASGGARAPVPRPNLEPSQTETKRRILVVDDELPMRRMTARVLSRMGHEVETAETGEGGWKLFDAKPHDLVITDQAMPGLTGEQFAERVRKRAPGTPVIMVTGFGELLRERGQPPLGVSMTLSKPIQVEQLAHAVRTVSADLDRISESAEASQAAQEQAQ